MSPVSLPVWSLLRGRRRLFFAAICNARPETLKLCYMHRLIRRFRVVQFQFSGFLPSSHHLRSLRKTFILIFPLACQTSRPPQWITIRQSRFLLCDAWEIVHFFHAPEGDIRYPDSPQDFWFPANSDYFFVFCLTHLFLQLFFVFPDVSILIMVNNRSVL
jgi:hypothetical protein